MRKYFPIAALVIVPATAISLAAQSQAEPKHVTVTGCIARGTTEAPAAATGSTTTPGPDTRFVLSNVATETKPTGTTGEARPGSIADARSYRLDDADQDKVAPHLGHTVEISGVVEQQAPPAVGTTGTTAPTDAIAPKLKVDTLRVISSDCSRK